MNRPEGMLAQRLAAAVRVVVLELPEVDFLDVPGLQLLTQTHLRAQDRGIELRMVAANHEAVHALQVAELGAALPCHATTADALASVEPGPT